MLCLSSLQQEISPFGAAMKKFPVQVLASPAPSKSHPLRLQYPSAYPHSVSANPCLQPTFFKAGGENAEKIKIEFTNLRVCILIIPYTCLFILSGASLKESNREAVITSVNLQHYLFAHQQKLLTLPLPFRMQKFWGCLQFMAGASSTS